MILFRSIYKHTPIFVYIYTHDGERYFKQEIKYKPCLQVTKTESFKELTTVL